MEVGLSLRDCHSGAPKTTLVPDFLQLTRFRNRGRLASNVRFFRFGELRELHSSSDPAKVLRNEISGPPMDLDGQPRMNASSLRRQVTDTR
jgi:hypothetical protein